MKLKNLLFYFAIGVSTLVFGLAWVGVYNFFLNDSKAEKPLIKPSIAVQEVKQIEDIKFDINDPESVLPIDYNEEALSDPKADENNPEYFDPEGTYLLSEKKKNFFSEFLGFTVKNKNFEADKKDQYYGELVSPRGYVNTTMGDFHFKQIYIANESIYFETENIEGVRYIFDGKFLVNGNFYTLDENTKVVHGNLSKVSGAKGYEIKNVTFTWTIDFDNAE